MRVFSTADVDAALDFQYLTDALGDAFRGGLTAPPRHHHEIKRADAPTATHLLMPAWSETPGGFLGVKIVNVFPSNAQRSLPAVHGTYVLQSADTGVTIAVMDGTRLTLWRTAAASALAARHLARKDSKKLLIVGAGSLAPFLAKAHASQRPIEFIEIWNHRPAGAERVAEALRAEGFQARATTQLQDAVGEADIISCATLSQAPLVAGAWLQPGQHVDLIGAFNMHMREVDDVALRRARVFIDTAAALTEGGDVAQAIASGVLAKSDIAADLAALQNGAPGRGSDGEITLFKSVGAAIEDLAAAALVWKRAGA